jgi:hypothetical protein
MAGHNLSPPDRMSCGRRLYQKMGAKITSFLLNAVLSFSALFGEKRLDLSPCRLHCDRRSASSTGARFRIQALGETVPTVIILP